MSAKTRTVVAVVCGVAAALLMALYAANVRGEAAGQRQSALERYGGETIPAYVTTRLVAQGETFSERNVAVVDWLVDLLPEGALVGGSDVLGRTAAAVIAENTPLGAVDIDQGGEPLEVPPGAVAVSVPCSNESAVGGALTAGSIVDVYVVSDGSARLLCGGITVLKTNAEGSAAHLSWATVAVDPAQVEALIAAAGMQRLYFVLPSVEEVSRRLAEPSPDNLPEASSFLPPGAVSGVAPISDDQPVPEEPMPYEGAEEPADPEEGDQFEDASI